MFMETARKAGELPSNACPAGIKTLNFFGEACAPGVNDRDINIANVTVPDSVCQACPRGGLGTSNLSFSRVIKLIGPTIFDMGKIAKIIWAIDSVTSESRKFFAIFSTMSCL